MDSRGFRAHIQKLVLLIPFALLANVPVAHAQSPVFNPANGHYYQWVPSGLDWINAKSSAESMSHLGAPGYLATIADAAEDAFIYYTLTGGALGNAWLGAWQDTSAAGYSEPAGGWAWVTGEPFTYTNWRAGEPNDGGGAEHYAGYWAGDQWNDYQLGDGAIGGYVVEFEANLGTRYCLSLPNSVGSGAQLFAAGSNSVAANDLMLLSMPVPDQPGLFFYGNTQVQVPFGDGLLCLTGQMTLLFAPAVGLSQQAVRIVDLSTLPASAPILGGSTWNFQYWYRDPAAGGAYFNLSDAVSISFVP